jgi:hypothetical protein
LISIVDSVVRVIWPVPINKQPCQQLTNNRTLHKGSRWRWRSRIQYSDTGLRHSPMGVVICAS